MKNKTYIGRYAPSPTGRLHLGNLRTALLAWLHARLHSGKFLLRMDDLDTPRVVKGSDTQILEDMEWLGLDWDGEVYYQSQYLSDYQDAFNTLKAKTMAYPCFCSRKDIQQAISAPHGKPSIYPSTCAGLTPEEITQGRQRKSPAWRMNVSRLTEPIEFNDGVHGLVRENLPKECGDFVIRRADSLFAYQLAVVVDDFQQGITDVVRGFDLLHSTARQLALYGVLYKDVYHNKKPDYWHVPLMLDQVGERLSKRDGSDSIEVWKRQAPEHLIGHLAFSIGYLNTEEPITLLDLLNHVSIEQWIKPLKL